MSIEVKDKIKEVSMWKGSFNGTRCISYQELMERQRKKLQQYVSNMDRIIAQLTMLGKHLKSLIVEGEEFEINRYFVLSMEGSGRT